MNKYKNNSEKNNTEKKNFLDMAKKLFKKKSLGFTLSRGLMAVATHEIENLAKKMQEHKEKGDLKKLERLLRMQNGYTRSYYCTEKLQPKMHKTGNKTRLIGRRCRCKWCSVCQSILMQNLMNKYGKAITEMVDPQFVTLTAPTVEGREGLEKRVDEFYKVWKTMTKDRYWRKHKPNGIRKTECTIRPNNRYHYHFHIIIDGKENAEWLQKQWLKRIPKAKHVAQDIRPVEKGKGGVLEIFKYFTKLAAKDARTGKVNVPYKQLHTIFTVLYGKNTFKSFGKIKQESEEEFGELISEHVPEEYFKEWGWMQSKELKVNGVGYVDEDKNVLTGDYKLPEWVGDVSKGISRATERIERIKGVKWERNPKYRKEKTEADRLINEVREMIREKEIPRAKKAAETLRKKKLKGELKEPEWKLVRVPKNRKTEEVKPPQKQGVEGEYPPDYEEP